MFETCEGRTLLAATIVNRVLEIRDFTSIEIYSAAAQTSVVVESGTIQLKFARSDLDSINIVGGSANNEFLVRNRDGIVTSDPDQFFYVPVRMHGGGGDDTMWGGYGNDTIFGSVGNDRVKASGGKDRVYGGDGRDTLSGGAGNDRLEGQADNDHLFGGSGDDTLLGSTGDDLYVGSSGDDKLMFYDGGFDVTLLWDSEEADRVVRDEAPGMVTFMLLDSIGACGVAVTPECDVILGR